MRCARGSTQKRGARFIGGWAGLSAPHAAAAEPCDARCALHPRVCTALTRCACAPRQPRVRPKAAPAAPAAPPPPPPKAPPPPPPAPPKYTGPVTRPASGRDAFDLVRTVVADVLQVDPLSFSEKTNLLADFQITNDDAQDITRVIGERGGVTWDDADWQTMRMTLLQMSLLEISHVVSDRAGVPRLDAWPVSAAPPAGAADEVDFV